MLIDFFYTLRSAKLPVSVKEYLTLMEALQKGVVGPNVPEPASGEEAAGFAIDDHLASARPFSSQYQAFFAVKPINEIAINIQDFTSEHNVNTPVIISNSRPDNLMHTQFNCRSRISYAWLALS